MWGPDDGPYEGHHYQLAQTLNSPQPLHRPLIMIGGSGERKTLRLVAQYGDACNFFVNERTEVPDIRHKLDVLRGHCSAAGTDYERIRKTILWAGSAHGTQLVQELQPYSEIGITEVHLMPPMGDPVAYIERLGAEVVPGLAALG